MVFVLLRSSVRLRTASRRWLSTSSTEVPLLLSPKQVENISKSNLVILDASWFMPNSSRNAKVEYLNKRIPSAQFLDLDEVASTHELGLKHMMPEPRVFAEACEKLGIFPSSHVVIYDSHGIFSSPRALFMFRAFGHQKSSIINGGLPHWRNEGYLVAAQHPAKPRPASYPVPRLDGKVIRSYEQMVSNAEVDPTRDSTAELVLDARSKGRYAGQDPEPRPGLQSGHIPFSISLPFNTFLQKHISNIDGSEYTTFLPRDDLRQALEAAVGQPQAQLIIRGKNPVVTTCGSGMTAGVLWLGLKLLGVKNVALYDESWTGYAMRPSSKIAKA